jgi:indolepyruvate ferredoxin oxidoreductase beta subunit
LQEVCDALPAALGEYVLRSARLSRVVEYFCRRGRRVRTATVSGFLLLYLLAGLRPLRRHTLRYRTEQARIVRWLALVAGVAPRDYGLAVEIAECPRLIKGYGDTHARGLRSYERILEALQSRIGRPELARQVREWRAAALADEHGELLNAALQRAA